MSKWLRNCGEYKSFWPRSLIFCPMQPLLGGLEIPPKYKIGVYIFAFKSSCARPRVPVSPSRFPPTAAGLPASPSLEEALAKSFADLGVKGEVAMEVLPIVLAAPPALALSWPPPPHPGCMGARGCHITPGCHISPSWGGHQLASTFSPATAPSDLPTSRPP